MAGLTKQGCISGSVYLSGPFRGLHGSEQLPSSVCCTRLAEELELPKLTFQVIRRTIATLAQKKGTVKDVQGMMRHSRTATTTDVYMQELPEGVRATVNSIHLELMGTGTSGPQSAASGTRSSIPARQHPNQSDRVNMTGRTRDREPATGKGGRATAEPSCK